MRRLVALIHAKLSTPNGAFASLTEICVANLTVESTKSRWVAERLDPWLGEFERACEEANVKIHTTGTTTSMQVSYTGIYPCSSCRPSEMGRLDSAPVIPGEEDQMALQ